MRTYGLPCRGELVKSNSFQAHLGGAADPFDVPGLQATGKRGRVCTLARWANSVTVLANDTGDEVGKRGVSGALAIPQV